MDAYILLEAIGEIDDRYILSAQNRLGLSPSETKQHHHIRRLSSLLVAIITAIAIFMSTFTVAFAVSEDFREAVIQFLGIRQTAVVPKHTQGQEPMAVEPEKPVFGNAVQGTYLHTPETSLARNGMFHICTDSQMMNGGSHFDSYVEENGRLVKLEPRHFRQDYTILGNDFHVEFEWVEHNGISNIQYIPANAPYRMQNLSGPSDSVLMTFECELDGYFTQYPVLVNLNTGQWTDVLAGTGADHLPGIYNAAISRDHSNMLLVLSNDDLYLVDLEFKKLYSIQELSGQRPDACAFAGNSLACWALEGASEKTRTLGTYRIWGIDLDTKERRELFSDLPATPATSYDAWSALYESILQIESDGSTTAFYPDAEGNYTLTEEPYIPFAGLQFLGGFSRASSFGNMYAGSGFAVIVDESRNVYVIDLESGEKIKIENYTWPDIPYPHLQCVPSADGQKLLIYGEMEENGKNDGCISDVGVLNFDEKRYLTFQRENANDILEDKIYWFDNQSVIIGTAPSREDPGVPDGTCDYYVYKILGN